MAALLALGAADGSWLASSFMAWRLGYARQLGRPWLVRAWYPERWLLSAFLVLVAIGAGLLLREGWRRGALVLLPMAMPVLLASLGPLYSPVRAIAWIHAYGRVPRLAEIVGTAERIGLAGLVACFASTTAYGMLSLRRLQRVGDLHGSSHWATVREVAAAGLLADGEGGIVVGRLGRRLLVDRKDRHALVYAPSGTGKSSCLVIPTLLRWTGSLLAFDIKGELWEKTAGYRASRKQIAIRFDPTLKQGSARYNPLLAIPRAEEDVAFAQDVADILVNPEGKETAGGERSREVSPGRRPVLLMLDEFTALGRLDFMHRGIGFFRGYGIRVFLSIQSLEQLFQIYGQHQSIGANCGVQVAYGANDVATAKLLSEMTGRRTVEYRRLGRSGGFFGGRRSESETEAGRPLLSADEVRRLPEGEALVYVAGCAPIRGARVPYWRDAELARRAGVPAPAESDRVQH